jgi:universal stress protein A
MFKNILLATDLSAVSHIVARKARDLADKFNAKLSAVYVLEYTPIVYGEGEYSISLDSGLLNVFEKNARSALAQLGKDFGIPDEQQYMEIGSARDVVIDLADKIKADLLVIGSHGKHGLSLLLGSKANAILHAAKCNVIAVRV